MPDPAVSTPVPEPQPQPEPTPGPGPQITGSTEPDPVLVPVPVPTPELVPVPVPEPLVPEPVAGPQSADWRDRRIAQLTAKLREANERAPLPAAAPAAPPVPAASGLTQADVEVRAQQLAAAQEFDRLCTAVAQDGKVAFPDFDSRLNQLKRLQNEADPNVAASYNAMIAAAVETGEGAKVIHLLGGDLEEASRIMSMTPMKMAVELTKLSQGAGARSVSAAPRPIVPIPASRGALNEIAPDDKDRADMLSDTEWFARRQADVDRKRAQGKEIY